jgi:hypothetical protein
VLLLLWIPSSTAAAVGFAGSAVLFLADGNGEFTKAMDLELDGSGFGLGTRSQRYAAVIEDGVVSASKIFIVLCAGCIAHNLHFRTSSARQSCKTGHCNIVAV